ncbi:ECF transporter S component [Aeromicrobium sp. CF4.19]|uniref:ECF transporter S component n=1 Tax=Aeromicrobium sp. CF4.19 TaxID=3373082 RepID=UPI003EE6BC7B
MSSASPSSPTPSSPARGRYRTIDLVTIASLGVAFGVVFWAWGKLYGIIDLAATVGYPPAGGLLAGPWLIAGIVGGLIVRKAGAAFATELVAAIVSMFVLGGTEWGFTVFFSGVVQGLGAELVVLVFAYRLWTLPVAVLMGAMSGALGAVYEAFVLYPDWTVGHQLVYGVLFALSGAVVAGGLGWVLVRALAGTGALDAFPAGREAHDRDAALT